MALRCISYPEFTAGDRIVSLVIHSPKIQNGTKATVVAPHVGTLYAVQLPNGELHRWVAWFEVQPINPHPYFNDCPQIGDSVRILTDKGHHEIKKGMVVKIAKVIAQTPFYDLRLDDGSYHRWLAEFEITQPI
jgi:hypothetical protein